ncbi:OLC1v1038028C1 [Oldenlandia corymbosa var. corymbosa]|uniref:OLC1v1038028C1 n=1 Tax=Oldenlandia corymbosa var. corymbosa TaxID=529605 RepID=A0AAV1D1X0_OLDCO|nr:OLC1v1038028C1 [Oldenlandia corymbosa var. corymbosa]
MWTTILFFVFLFIAGLISTVNFPRKKFLAWFFGSFCAELRDPMNPVISTSDSAAASNASTKANKIKPDEDGGTGKKKKSSCYDNKSQLRSVFSTFDKNNDGFITKQELKDSLKNIGIVMSESDVAEMIKRVDSNGDGLIDLDEFCQSFDSLLSRGGEEEGSDEKQGKMDGNNNINNNDDGDDEDGDEDLKEAFDVFDGDKDGVITVEELGLVLSSLGFKQGNKVEDCKEMIRKVDMDGDGMVNFDEFKKMMKSGHRLVPIS